MAVPWLAIGTILSAGSAVSGIFSAGANKQQAQISSQIAQTKRRTSGYREMDALQMGMNMSGVELDPTGKTNASGGLGKGAKFKQDYSKGSDRIGYSAGKKGFLGIGQKDGGYIQNARDYSRASDTAAVILGTSRDSINLDISAMKLDASNAAFAFTVEGFNAGLETFSKIAFAGAAISKFNEENNQNQKQPQKNTLKENDYYGEVN